MHAKAVANVAALRVLNDLEGSGRAVSDTDRSVLANYSGWGALPYVLDPDPRPEWVSLAGDVRGVVSAVEWEQARASTLNAHYSDPLLAGAIWDAVVGLGASGGRVLEPGCGPGRFLGACPTPGLWEFVGVEIDSVSARIARVLFPTASIRTEPFEQSRFPVGSFDAVWGTSRSRSTHRSTRSTTGIGSRCITTRF